MNRKQYRQSFVAWANKLMADDPSLDKQDAKSWAFIGLRGNNVWGRLQARSAVEAWMHNQHSWLCLNMAADSRRNDRKVAFYIDLRFSKTARLKAGQVLP